MVRAVSIAVLSVCFFILLDVVRVSWRLIGPVAVVVAAEYRSVAGASSFVAIKPDLGACRRPDAHNGRKDAVVSRDT